MRSVIVAAAVVTLSVGNVRCSVVEGDSFQDAKFTSARQLGRGSCRRRDDALDPLRVRNHPTDECVHVSIDGDVRYYREDEVSTAGSMKAGGAALATLSLHDICIARSSSAPRHVCNVSVAYSEVYGCDREAHTSNKKMLPLSRRFRSRDASSAPTCVLKVDDSIRLVR